MCEHKNLKTVGDRLFCLDCGVELPLEFLYKKDTPKKTTKGKKKNEGVGRE